MMGASAGVRDGVSVMRRSCIGLRITRRFDEAGAVGPIEGIASSEGVDDPLGPDEAVA